jgi:hypothetical protein
MPTLTFFVAVLVGVGVDVDVGVGVVVFVLAVVIQSFVFATVGSDSSRYGINYLLILACRL